MNVLDEVMPLREILVKQGRKGMKGNEKESAPG